MTGVSPGAGADGLVVLHLTFGPVTTGALTRVHALKLETRLVAGAVIMGCALGVATAMSITLVVLWAGADSTVILDVTVRTLPTRVTARVHTDVVPAAHIMRTVAISHTLRGTAGQWRANIVLDARADSTVVLHLAVGVAATRGGMTQLLGIKSPAAGEGVADEAPGAGADRLVVPGHTLGTISTDAKVVARIHTI